MSSEIARRKNIEIYIATDSEEAGIKICEKLAEVGFSNIEIMVSESLPCQQFTIESKLKSASTDVPVIKDIVSQIMHEIGISTEFELAEIIGSRWLLIFDAAEIVKIEFPTKGSYHTNPARLRWLADPRLIPVTVYCENPTEHQALIDKFREMQFYSFEVDTQFNVERPIISYSLVPIAAVDKVKELMIEYLPHSFKNIETTAFYKNNTRRISIELPDLAKRANVH